MDIGTSNQISVADRESASFLVRVWREPQASTEAGSKIRVYVRNLKTGEVQYVDSPEAIPEHLVGTLRAAAAG